MELQTVTIDGVKQDVRNMMQVKMEVVCRPSSQTLPNGQIAYAGEPCVISVYQDQVPAVKALVETRTDELKRANELFEAQLLSEAKEKVEARRGSGEKIKDHDEAVETELDTLRQTTGDSVESVFLRKVRDPLDHKDIMPLVSAKVVGQPFAPPHKQREFDSTQETLKQIVPVIVEAVKAANAGLVEAQVKAVLDEHKKK
jgi:hypothetical protein